MNPQDPTAPETRRVEVLAQPLTVEEVARRHAAATAAADPTRELPTKETAAAPGRTAAVPLRPVSGRYRSAGKDHELELRVDVDGRLPLTCVSGDFFHINGSTRTFFGSFVVHSPALRVTASEVEIEGFGNYTWTAGYPKLRVVIGRAGEAEDAGGAAAQFMAHDGGPGEKYTCSFESPFFRTIEFEQDKIAGVQPFDCYDTGNLESGGPPRVLTVAGAYAEAGIEIRQSGECNEIAVEAGDNVWSSAELHEAMLKWFSLHSEEPQWKVWLLAASRHERGPQVRGLMFDQRGKQRQGCAVFHDALGGGSPADLRGQLRTYVHEIGHCFNLAHPWLQSGTMPPIPSRPNTLSYMNYPQQFQPGGDPDFWASFPFSFDLEELMHLRHGFRNSIIMGGDDFRAGAADEAPPAFDAPLTDESRLELRLEAPKAFSCGEPVVIELRLSTTDPEGRRVHSEIHPNSGFVQMGIRLPSGRVRRYLPLLEQCAEGSLVTITPDQPLYESAYIGYGRGGFYFDETGVYQVRAAYRAIDGSTIVSNICSFRVRTPLSEADEEVADRFFGENQGTLFFLLGSRADALSRGRAALDEVIERFSTHRLAAYACLVKGWNLRKGFKSVDLHGAAERVQPGESTVIGRVQFEPPKLDATVELLSQAVNSAKAHRQIDNITLRMMMGGLAQARERQGDIEGAGATIDEMISTFKARKLKDHVLEAIRREAQSILKSEG
jgi:hypothetical protein